MVQGLSEIRSTAMDWPGQLFICACHCGGWLLRRAWNQSYDIQLFAAREPDEKTLSVKMLVEQRHASDQVSHQFGSPGGSRSEYLPIEILARGRKSRGTRSQVELSIFHPTISHQRSRTVDGGTCCSSSDCRGDWYTDHRLDNDGSI